MLLIKVRLSTPVINVYVRPVCPQTVIVCEEISPRRHIKISSVLPKNMES